MRLAFAVAIMSLLTAGAHAEEFDVLIKGGTILDGSGAAGFAGDVGVIDGRIAKIGDLAAATARREIDARGLYVAPGFVNIHGHPEPNALFKSENMLTQGVTSEIGNADGYGTTDLAKQAQSMAANGLATNLGLYIGFNAAWAEVMGNVQRRPTAADISRMRELVSRGLEQGAWGVSAGLDYKPAYWAHTDEVVRVVEVARPWRTNFPNHERLTPETGYSGLVAAKETIDIGLAADLVPVITHMKAQGQEQLTAHKQLELMDEAGKAGRFVAGDIYPYTYGFNNVSSLLIPAWAHEGGKDALFARFRDPETRARIIADIERVMLQRWNGPTGVYIVALQRELTDLMAEWNVSAGEAVVRLNEKYGPSALTYLRFGVEEDVSRMLRHPNVAVSCDCGALLPVYGHPRAFGTFPRVLRQYVRESGVMTWEEAVFKMSGLPASIIGMTDRGFIAPGMAADIAVFDPRTITDRGTEQAPQLAEGVRYVLVNGRVALSDGKVTGEQGGVVLRRAANMPSRPLDLSTSRRLSGTASVNGETHARIELDVRQAPGQRWAEGAITVKDADGRAIFQSDTLGVLQMTPEWASITGQGRLANGAMRAFTLIVDQGSVVPASQRAVELSVDAGPQWRAASQPIQSSVAR